MATTAAPGTAVHALPRAMGLRDLVLFNIVAVSDWSYVLPATLGALLGAAVYLRGRR
jgi:hypothetical protein